MFDDGATIAICLRSTALIVLFMPDFKRPDCAENFFVASYDSPALQRENSWASTLLTDCDKVQIHYICWRNNNATVAVGWLVSLLNMIRWQHANDFQINKKKVAFCVQVQSQTINPAKLECVKNVVILILFSLEY